MGSSASSSGSSRVDPVASWTSCSNDRMRKLPYLKTPRMPRLVQIESEMSVANIDAIAAVEGVDGLFIGPSDLSAGLGHFGEPNHPDVQSAIARIVESAKNHGKPNNVMGYEAGDVGCTVEPPEYQKLAGAWVDGKDPAGE